MLKNTLLDRRSCAKLVEPAPDTDELDTIFKAAYRVPDHRALKPVRFVVFKNSGLKKLAKILEDAYLSDCDQVDDFELNKIRNLAARAPMVVVAITKHTPHNSVPAVEQIISSGCSAFAVQLMAEELGYSSIWRTGKYTNHEVTRKALNLTSNESVIAFLYCGTASNSLAPKTVEGVKNYYQVIE